MKNTIFFFLIFLFFFNNSSGQILSQDTLVLKRNLEKIYGFHKKEEFESAYSLINETIILCNALKKCDYEKNVSSFLKKIYPQILKIAYEIYYDDKSNKKEYYIKNEARIRNANKKETELRTFEKIIENKKEIFEFKTKTKDIYLISALLFQQNEKYEKAIEQMEKVLKIQKKLKKNIFYETYLFGNILFDKQDYEKALKKYETALSLIDEKNISKKISIIYSKSKTYEKIYETKKDENFLFEAFENYQKTDSIIYEMFNSVENVEKNIFYDLKNFYNDANSNALKLYFLKNKKKFFSKSYDFLEKEKFLNSIILQKFLSVKKNNNDNIQAKREISDENLMIISYKINKSEIIFYLKAKNFISVKKLEIKIDTLEKKINDFIISIKKINYDNFCKNSHFLYNILISPFEEEIENKTKLLIIPYGFLYRLPFEALLCQSPEKNTKNNYSKLNYLIKYFEISYNYSETEWNKFKEKKIIDNNSLICFAPIEWEKNWDTLLHSEEEIENIILLSRKSNISYKKYIYENATEKNFLLSSLMKKYIHISSHGFFNEENPKLSGIIFKNPPDELTDSNTLDDFLNAKEMFNLKINANLIVISSCKILKITNMNENASRSMTNGFFCSGVSNVIYSMWEIDDETTKNFMKDFYEEALKKNDNFSFALQKAKKNMIEKSSIPPKFWVPYILIGN